MVVQPNFSKRKVQSTAQPFDAWREKTAGMRACNQRVSVRPKIKMAVAIKICRSPAGRASAKVRIRNLDFSISSSHLFTRSVLFLYFLGHLFECQKIHTH